MRSARMPYRVGAADLRSLWRDVRRCDQQLVIASRFVTVPQQLGDRLSQLLGKAMLFELRRDTNQPAVQGPPRWFSG